MKKVKINDITLNNGENITSKTSVKILSHKDFAPLEEEIVEVQERGKKGRVFTIISVLILIALLFLYIGHIFSSATVEVKRLVCHLHFQMN